MKLQLLGTAAAEGWPAVFCGCGYCERARELGGKNIRSRSQAVIDDCILVDLPPDTYMHMALNGLKLYEIEHLIVTHSHGDHWQPWELIMRGPGFSQKNAGVLTVYGNAAVMDGVRKIYNEQPGTEKYVACRQLKPFESVRIGKYEITALRALHKRDEECLLYLVGDGADRILYGLDTGCFPEDTWAFLENVKLSTVVLDCTFQGRAEGTNHMGLPDNVKVRQRLLETGAANDKTAFIVHHFSHNGGLDHETLETEAAKAGFLAAYDGMTVGE